MAKRKAATNKKKSFPQVTDEQITKTLIETEGTVTEAGRRLGITGRAIYYRCEANPELVGTIKEARELRKDKAELSLFKAIDEGQSWAVCFFLKTQARERGYIEKHEVDFDGHLEHGGTINIRAVADELQQSDEWTQLARANEQNRNARLLRDEREPPNNGNGKKNKPA